MFSASLASGTAQACTCQPPLSGSDVHMHAHFRLVVLLFHDNTSKPSCTCWYRCSWSAAVLAGSGCLVCSSTTSWTLYKSLRPAGMSWCSSTLMPTCSWNASELTVCIELHAWTSTPCYCALYGVLDMCSKARYKFQAKHCIQQQHAACKRAQAPIVTPVCKHRLGKTCCMA